MTLAKARAAEVQSPREVIDLVVKKLYQITRETTLDYSIRVGSLIIHYFYAGDMKTWRRKGPKTHSFRALASHPELPMSASTLYRCVAVYELCERLGVVNKWNRITVSHLRLVLRLDEPDQQRLLSAANSERWSVQRLQTEALTLQRRAGSRGGRAAAPKLAHYTRFVERLLKTSESLLAELPDAEPILDSRYSHVRDALEHSIRSLEQARHALGQCGEQALKLLTGGGESASWASGESAG
jgi:hypothetical protein